jgi:hypothetical protein
MYTIVLVKEQGTHLSVPDGQLELCNSQLGRLTVSVWPLEHAVDQS